MVDIDQDRIAKIQLIEAQGPSVEVGAMRLRLLKETIGARVDQRAEYAIVVGCNTIWRFYTAKSLVDLLERLGVSYTFLSREFCCGHSYLPASHRGPEMADLEPYVQQHQDRNMAAAEALGARALVTFCPNCNAHYRKYLEHPRLPILYWIDVVADKLGGLKLDKRVDFYEGCHRDQNIVLRGAIDTAASKKLIDGIEGLTYNEVSSKICCIQKPQEIYAAMETDTLVTPTTCCYGYLSRSRPRATRLVFLAEALLWGMDGRAAAS